MTVNVYKIRENGERSKSYRSINRVIKIEEDEEDIKLTFISAYLETDYVYYGKENHSMDIIF